MKKLMNIAVIVAVMMTLSVSAFAQKFGHINSGNLLEMLPETKAAQDELTKFTEGLQTSMDQSIATFRAKVEKFQTTDPSSIPPKELEATKQALLKEENDLRKTAQENEIKVGQKREELLQPIFDKADNAIKAVGKEQGYTYIFDSSAFNLILFAEETTDIMADVKKKLGLN